MYLSFKCAHGMAHLERKQLIHRDLAARNVLIGENLIAKVGAGAHWPLLPEDEEMFRISE